MHTNATAQKTIRTNKPRHPVAYAYAPAMGKGWKRDDKRERFSQK